MHLFLFRGILLALMPVLPFGFASAMDPPFQPEWQPHPENCFVITVIDDATSRGVPLVELMTRNGIRFYSDSNGVIAISEPGLMGQKVFFDIASHGYEYMGRNFLGRGEQFDVIPGGSATISVRRRNIAERLYRITGEGIYRDSVMAGRPVPIRNPLMSGKVTGQDTVITAIYRDKIFWCWGDTLGLATFNLSASGATSELPGRGGLDPGVGVDLTYFVNEDSGFSKAMCAYESPGLKWIEGLFTIRDDQGIERLMARCSSMRGLSSANEWHLIVFNDEKQAFDSVVRWADYHVPHRSAHPFHAMVDGKDYIYIFPFLRVRADMEHLKDLTKYERFTPLVQGSSYSKDDPRLERDANGRLVYGWKTETDSVEEHRQRELVQAGKMKPEECWYTPQDIDSGQPIDIRIGSVCWNEFAKRWILICERGGEIWYLQGDTPTGPWAYAKKIVSHNRYTFYNPAQHAFFDQDGGRKIYFEGTYTESFSAAPFKTPHYDYNQIMYRLTLDDPRLLLPAAVYRVESAKGNSRYLMRDAIAAENLWDRVREVAFFALPPQQDAPETVAVYGDDNASVFHTPALHPGIDKPLFRALPVGEEAAAASFAGQWMCKFRTDTGFENEFPLELEQEANLVKLISRRGGESVSSSGTLTSENEVSLAIRRGVGFRVNVTLRLEQGKLTGMWEQADGPMNGTLEGMRQEEATPENFAKLQAQSPATVLLYEFQNRDKGVIYLTSADSAVKVDGQEYLRSGKPLCRVWKSPIIRPQLDAKAQPMPLAIGMKQ